MYLEQLVERGEEVWGQARKSGEFPASVRVLIMQSARSISRCRDTGTSRFDVRRAARQALTFIEAFFHERREAGAREDASS